MTRIQSLGFLWFWAVSQCAVAQVCFYQGTSEASRVISRSGVVYTPFPNVLSSQDCSKLKAVNHAVTVYIPTQGAVAAKKTVPAGEALMPSSAAPPLLDNALAQSILFVLDGAQRVRTGSSRNAADFLSEAMPKGRVAESSQDLLIPWATDAMEGGAVELWANGKRMATLTPSAQALRIPAQHLKSGTRIDWRLTLSKQPYQGYFDVVPLTALQDIEQRLQEQLAAEGDPKLRAMHMANALIAHDFFWHARQHLALAFGAP